MSIQYDAEVQEVRRMSDILLRREFRGPGDTIEGAAYRLQTRYGIPAATTMRLRNRDVKDMFLSSVLPIIKAYLSIADRINAAADRMEFAYEKERDRAADTLLRRMADAVRGTKVSRQDEAQD